jgi:hypothetical protein
MQAEKRRQLLKQNDIKEKTKESSKPQRKKEEWITGFRYGNLKNSSSMHSDTLSKNA